MRVYFTIDWLTYIGFKKEEKKLWKFVLTRRTRDALGTRWIQAGWTCSVTARINMLLEEIVSVLRRFEIIVHVNPWDAPTKFHSTFTSTTLPRRMFSSFGHYCGSRKRELTSYHKLQSHLAFSTYTFYCTPYAYI